MDDPSVPPWARLLFSKLTSLEQRFESMSLTATSPVAYPDNPTPEALALLMDDSRLPRDYAPFIPALQVACRLATEPDDTQHCQHAYDQLILSLNNSSPPGSTPTTPRQKQTSPLQQRAHESGPRPKFVTGRPEVLHLSQRHEVRHQQTTALPVPELRPKALVLGVLQHGHLLGSKLPAGGPSSAGAHRQPLRRHGLTVTFAPKVTVLQIPSAPSPTRLRRNPSLPTSKSSRHFKQAPPLVNPLDLIPSSSHLQSSQLPSGSTKPPWNSFFSGSVRTPTRPTQLLGFPGSPTTSFTSAKRNGTMPSALSFQPSRWHPTWDSRFQPQRQGTGQLFAPLRTLPPQKNLVFY